MREDYSIKSHEKNLIFAFQFYVLRSAGYGGYDYRADSDAVYGTRGSEWHVDVHTFTGGSGFRDGQFGRKRDLLDGQQRECGRITRGRGCDGACAVF